MYKIRTFNQIADKGLALFSPEQYEVSDKVSKPSALLLRSHKLAAGDIDPDLSAIARAGAGVNNVPVGHCTEHGVAVFNTPGANANSVKELVLASLLLSSRDVVGGMNYVSSLGGISDEAELNRLVEAEKKRFKGQELKGKSLGVVGLGAIGSLVAKAALDLGMDVLGYDPAISVDAAWRLPSEVQRMENLPSLFSRADYITLHVPLLDVTRGLIDAAAFSQFKKGAVLINFARQPIVDTDALIQALDNKTVGFYVADFPVPGLTDHPNVRLTPHLGASTDEAEENCAVMAARQLIDFLETGNITNSVNFPPTYLADSGSYRIAITNRNLPGLLGKVTAALAHREINVVEMLNKSRDDIAYNLIDIADKPEQPLIDSLRAIEDVIRVNVLPGPVN